MGSWKFLRLLVVVRAVARQVAAREAVVDLLQSLDGDVTGAVGGLVDGECDDQGRDDVGVGGAVRQGDAVAAGVAGDDEGGVVAEQALLDAFRLLLAPGALLVLPVGSEVVEGEGIFVLGGAHIPGSVGVGGGDGAVRGEPLGVGADDGGIDADRAVPAVFQERHRLPQGHGQDQVGQFDHECALAGELVRVGLGHEFLGMAAGQAVVLGQRGRVDRSEDAVQAAADGGVGGFEAAVVVGVAAQAELLAHRLGEGEEQQVGDGGERHDAAAAGGGQAHADQQGLNRELAGAAGAACDERLDLLDQAGAGHFVEDLGDFEVGNEGALGA
ncbi:hypothetical protein ACH4UM_15255 [Streptomyces sp. NPDC020801]|uniref:hypothetical protein n=1 Tax=Streptomyces sp. NPDC020801 TaxID=3365093 RepID=UPI0037BDD642